MDIDIARSSVRHRIVFLVCSSSVVGPSPVYVQPCYSGYSGRSDSTCYSGYSGRSDSTCYSGYSGRSDSTCYSGYSGRSDSTCYSGYSGRSDSTCYSGNSCVPYYSSCTSHTSCTLSCHL